MEESMDYYKIRLESLLNLWMYGKPEDRMLIDANKNIVEVLVKGYRQFEGQKNSGITRPAYDSALPALAETLLLEKYN